MRKLLLTTAVVLPLSMGTAFAQDATTEELPADQTEAGTDMPVADPAAEQEAMAAEVAASGKVVQQQAANEWRVDWITDATVTSPAGNAIGDINDLIIDAETGQMIAAVIGVGGFLGIGEKQIAVPWDQLTVNSDAQQINSDLSEEEADAAPEYVFRERDAAPVATMGDEVAPMDAAEAPAVDPAADPAVEGTVVEETAMEPADSVPSADPALQSDEETMDGEAPASDMEPVMEEPAEGAEMGEHTEGEAMEEGHTEGEAMEEQPPAN